MSIEAMNQALEALESWQKTCLDCGRGSEELGRATRSITALHTAIEQAEKQDDDDLTIAYMSGYKDGRDKERKEFAVHAVDIARKAVEEEREACAKVLEDMKKQIDSSWALFDENQRLRAELKFNTTPPAAKREWVGLTDDQLCDDWENITGYRIFGGDRGESRQMYISPEEIIWFVRALEAQLKEKNT